MNKFKTLFLFGLVPVVMFTGMILAMVWAYVTKPDHVELKSNKPKETIKEVVVEKIIVDTFYVKVPCNRQHAEVKTKKDTI